MLLNRGTIDWLIGKGHYLGYLCLIGLVVLGLMTVVHNLTYLRPSDGSQWRMEHGRLTVAETDMDASNAFQIGDVVLRIDDTIIEDIDSYDEYLHSMPIGSKHLYLLDRNGVTLQPWVEIKGRKETNLQYYLFAFTGFIYLIFLFLFLSQDVTTAGRPYLAAFCFFVYLAFVFHHTDRFTLLDWFCYYLDHAGSALLPSAMLALAIKQAGIRGRWQAALQALHVIPSLGLMNLFLFGVPRVSANDVAAGREYFLNLQSAQGLWGGGLIIAAVVLLAFRAERSPRNRNFAFFWAIAWVPFALTLWNLDFPYAHVIASLAPIVLPAAQLFEWSRTGNLFLGEIGKAVAVYLSVVFVLIVGYFLFLALFQWMLGSQVNQDTQALVTGLAIMFAALSYGPLKHFGSEWLDRLVYGERFDWIRELLDFSGFNRADTNIDEFLNIILRRIQRAFAVEGGAIYSATRDPRVFRPTRADRGMPIVFEKIPPKLLEGEIVRGYQVQLDDQPSVKIQPFKHQDFICPFRVSGRLAHLIAFSLKKQNDRLSPEEMRLLKNLLSQCDVLMENMELYQAVHQKASSILQLKEYNENIIESSRIGILTTDNMGRAVSCNSAFAELVGMSRDEIMGKTFEEMLYGREAAHVRQETTGLAQEGSYHNAKGEELMLEIQKTPLKTKENEVYGTLIMVEDIRERKQIHEKMMQQEKLASIGLLAAGVAHEINTPLTGIASYTQLMADDRKVREEHRELLNLIQGQSQRAAGIVASLLNFSRKENVPKGLVDLQPVLDQTLSFLSHQIQKAKVRVTVREPSFEARVQGYPNQLQQVFVNLIVNALDAMPDGGSLEIGYQARRGNIAMTFKDTGVGMDLQVKGRIFDPFFTTKEMGKGTGLGLAVVYNIMQDHGGSIEVDSNQGGGTVFKLLFPRKKKRHRADRSAGYTAV